MNFSTLYFLHILLIILNNYQVLFSFYLFRHQTKKKIIYNYYKKYGLILLKKLAFIHTFFIFIQILTKHYDQLHFSLFFSYLAL